MGAPRAQARGNLPRATVRVLLLACAVGACDDSSRPVVLSSEELGAEIEWVGLLALRGGVLAASTGLLARDDARAASLELEAGDGLELLGFRDETLERVGPPGREELSRTRLALRDEGPALPAADLRLSGVFDGDGAQLTAAIWPRRISAGWCVALDPCDYWAFEARTISLAQSPVRVRSAVRWSDAEVLVLTSDARWFVVDVAHGHVGPSRTATGSAFVLHAYREREAYGVGVDGELIRFQDDADTELLPTPLPSPRWEKLELDGSRDEHTLELFALTDGRRLFRYAENAWSLAFESDGVDHRNGEVLWVAPGRAVVALGGQREVVRYDDGRITRIPFPGGATPQAPALVPGVGILIGSHQGRVFRLDGEVLEPYLELPATLERVRFMNSFEDGLAFVLGANYLGAHHPEYGICEARPFAAGTVSVTRPFALGDRIVTASVGGDDVLPFLLVLERGEKPRPRCLPF